MKPLTPSRLVVAAAAVLTASFSVNLSAQTQLPQLIPQIAVQSAEAFLPDAPTPQSSDQAASAPAAGSAASTGSQTSSQPATPTAAPQEPAADAADAKKKQHDAAEQQLKAEEKQRLLGIMPQFQVVMNGQAVPLTGGEKWKLALHSAIDPFYIGWAFVIGGGYGELVNSNRGYDWGPGGYFWRVGANYADNVNGALIGNALLPQLLHQDPRYFRLGHGSFGRRFLHAALSTVECHGDNGKNQPNISNVLGNYISGAISNAYYPAQQRGVALTLENGTSVTLFGALGGQILEFGPDIAHGVRYLQGKREPKIVTPPATPSPSMPSAPAPPDGSH